MDVKKRIGYLIELEDALRADADMMRAATASGGQVNVLHVDLGSGKTVTCVSVGDKSVSCDWAGAR